MTGNPEIPVVEVHKENFTDLWPSLVLAVKSSTFLAIDTELSGLGDRKRLNAKSIEDRYSALYDVARSRAVVSLGLSCFKLQELSSNDTEIVNMPFLVQTFNIMLLCSEDYMVEPKSLKFLVDHGFDFNRQYSLGIPYYRGSDQGDDRQLISIRRLFDEIVMSKKPLVLHNGLVDLVFLYYSFYSDLPTNMPTFVTDLSEVFSGGIYDTKYITEFTLRFQASYLEYVFRKSQRLNRTSNRVVILNFPPYSSSEHVTIVPCDVKEEHRNKEKPVVLCENFAHHGWCVRGIDCHKSHDMDCILDQEDKHRENHERKRKRRNKRRAEKRFKDKFENSSEDLNEIGETEVEMNVVETDIVSEELNPATGQISAEDENESMDQSVEVEEMTANDIKESKDLDNGHTKSKPLIRISRAGGHRAGFDAYMTGYIFCHYLSCVSKEYKISNSQEIMEKTKEIANKLSLSAKDFPLLVTRSGFSKTSKAHQLKYNKLFPTGT